jgi:calcium-dependent protein kinase
LIRRMMTFEPAKRLTAEQALADVWISKNAQKGTVQIEELQDSLQQLQAFKTQSTLHKAVLTYMAAHLISVQGEAKARELFETFDINHDGQLSRDELLECYQTIYAGDLELARREVDKTLKNVDLNKNGTIDYNGGGGWKDV